jgi:hypothetical protein
MVGFGAEDICPSCGLVVAAEVTDARRTLDEELLARLRSARHRPLPADDPGAMAWSTTKLGSLPPARSPHSRLSQPPAARPR